MSFWSFLSRKKPVTRPPVPSAPPVAEQRPSFTDADREYIRTALDRFVAHGLEISPELNRGLIVARALTDMDRWKSADGHLDDDVTLLFLALAAENNSLMYYVDEVRAEFPSIAEMDDDDAETLLAQHSGLIFMNAASICTLNEGNSLESMVLAFAALSGLDTSDVHRHLVNGGLTRVSFRVAGSDECHFDIESTKRPDITPALAEMNRIVQSKGIGRYAVVPEGNSDRETFVFATEAVLSRLTNLLKLWP